MDRSERHENSDGEGLQISAGEDDLKGRYANLMSVSHTGEEFVLDFVAVTPSAKTPHGTLVSRVIVSPPHFKRIVAALGDNLGKYERQFGDIEEQRGGSPEDIGFIH